MLEPAGAPTLVITSVSTPNDAMRSFAAGCESQGWSFVVIGDEQSPDPYELPGCRFVGIEEQASLGSALEALLPKRHYARKNLGYLLAARAAKIVESDDDNIPLSSFWELDSPTDDIVLLENDEWVNVYRYFTAEPVWPRGLPLDAIRRAAPERGTRPRADVAAPIRQALANGEPDIDAIYRLVHGPQDVTFCERPPVALGRGSWCPFNSQNTTWLPEAFALLYLPSTCPGRVTDIWRSFVAQRVAWTCGWSILHGSATVRQQRNQHDPLRDFADEVDGYLHNGAIAQALAGLELDEGPASIATNMTRCYELMVERAWLDRAELDRLHAWFVDLDRSLAGALR